MNEGGKDQKDSRPGAASKDVPVQCKLSALRDASLVLLHYGYAQAAALDGAYGGLLRTT